MTREQAKNLLHNSKPKSNNAHSLMLNEALDMAIEALQQEPCKDCISRESVRQLICKNNDRYGYSDRFHEFTEECLQLPSVTPHYTDVEIQKIQEMEQAEIQKAYKLGEALQPKTGHWTRVTDKTGHLVWECDCGWQQRFYTNYCPDCGKKMVEPQESEVDV